MIIGSCPYEECDAPLFMPIADSLGFQRHACEQCGGVIWTLHSRIDPWSMTEAEFLVEYDVDDERKTITPRAAS